MYRLLYAVYAKEGMSSEAFRDHWVNVHGEIGKRLSHMASYTMYPVLSAEGELGPEVAGFAVVEFESEAEFQAAGGTEAMQEAIEDSPNFARHMAAYVVEGHRIQ